MCSGFFVAPIKLGGGADPLALGLKMFELLENRSGELTKVAMVADLNGLDMFFMDEWQGFDDFTDEARKLLQEHGTLVLVLWGMGNHNLIRWRVLTKKGAKGFARERLGVDLAALRRAPRNLGTTIAELLDHPQYSHPLKPVRHPQELAPESSYYATAETWHRYRGGMAK